MCIGSSAVHVCVSLHGLNCIVLAWLCRVRSSITCSVLSVGSAMSSQLGRLMVDMLVESEQWIQDIMAFFSIFIKLKDATTSKAFKVEE